MNLAKNTVFAVIGTTSVGKSKLGIELAKAINGEIINSDSLQVYKGFNTITNKVTNSEREQVPHHLLDFLDPSVQYTVQDFETDSIKKIKEISEMNKVPILVGGTNYYTQSVIFNNSLVTKNSREESEKFGCIQDKKYYNSTENYNTRSTPIENGKINLENCSSNEIIERLRKIDPTMASVWHPNDRRRAIRSLEVFYETGKLHSEWIKESQSHEKNDNQSSDPDVLYQRIRNREGLFTEIDEFSKYIESRVDGNKSKPTYDFGISQAIGFREFEEYWKEVQTNGQSGKALELKENGIEEMKRNTNKYAKKQVSWIKNKFLPMVKEAKNSKSKILLYVLDATDLNDWDKNVKEKAIDIAQKFLLNEPLPEMNSTSELASLLWNNIKKRKRIDDLIKIKCEICSDNSKSRKEVYSTGEAEHKLHLKSKRHQKTLKYIKTMEELAKRGITFNKKTDH
ncbi:hypothetical protein BB561_003703 [Smittium simulii]|uniref:Uncharacterized protein n=1 Tax=Smittium simulii TaxID=133385 RepID=A0A2T9YJZ5_9FUNG|nr:hypothetical protein BB561_003703 [Smittium simulii]